MILTLMTYIMDMTKVQNGLAYGLSQIVWKASCQCFIGL